MSERTSSPRILVVDHDIEAAELVARALEQLGHDVDRVHLLDDCVAFVRGSAVDIVLLAADLPGLERLPALLAGAPGGDTRWVAMVEREDPWFPPAPFIARLRKPVDLLQLVELVRTA